MEANDPVQGTNTDLSTVKKKYGSQIAIWGGVSGAITVEMGTEQEINAAVDKAVEELGPRGFILRPVRLLLEGHTALLVHLIRGQ